MSNGPVNTAVNVSGTGADEDPSYPLAKMLGIIKRAALEKRRKKNGRK